MAFVPIYILILLATIIIDYIAGIMIENAEGRRRRAFLILSLVANIGVLVIFKYYNFFAININTLADASKAGFSIPLLKILLPIGLSFHTFQAMSYTLEVYRDNQKAERHFGIYALYVMFYPQLVAGPIERPQNLLDQFHAKHDFSYDNCRDGIRLMIWGFFKKIVIADRLAIIVNNVYNDPRHFNGVALTIATLFFAFQVYCDFSGYTDIARGAAKTMGYDLMLNFNRPFASKSVTEIWRRWHISLSTWFFDYLFNPLVASLRKWGRWAIVFGLLFTFFLSGLWHGANWKYIIWGSVYGVALVYEFLTKNFRKKIFSVLPPTVNKTISIFLTFSFFVLASVFFRGKSVKDALYIFAHLFKGWKSVCSVSGIKSVITAIGGNDTVYGSFNVVIGFLLIAFLEIIQFRTKDTSPENIVRNSSSIVKWSYYYFLIIAIFVIGAYDNQEFIYFQF